jgi:hypothetical protein
MCSRKRDNVELTDERLKQIVSYPDERGLMARELLDLRARLRAVESDECTKKVAEAVRSRLEFHHLSETAFDEQQVAFAALQVVRALLVQSGKAR